MVQDKINSLAIDNLECRCVLQFLSRLRVLTRRNQLFLTGTLGGPPKMSFASRSKFKAQSSGLWSWKSLTADMSERLRPRSRDGRVPPPNWPASSCSMLDQRAARSWRRADGPPQWRRCQTRQRLLIHLGRGVTSALRLCWSQCLLDNTVWVII